MPSRRVTQPKGELIYQKGGRRFTPLANLIANPCFSMQNIH